MYVFPSSDSIQPAPSFFRTMDRWSPSSNVNGVNTRQRSKPSGTIFTFSQTVALKSRSIVSMDIAASF